MKGCPKGSPFYFCTCRIQVKQFEWVKMIRNRKIAILQFEDHPERQ